MAAYYNEFDKKTAAWLRELIKNNLIADGEVDERSITEVQADDLRGFDQCHFFAGIGCWSYALRLAGVPDDYPLWTGSCPCQPFSAAGKNKGKSDDRHLWPEFFRLIKQSRPDTVFGEQVERAIAHGWLDDLQADMEGEGYSVGAAVLGAHSVGAPHVRQRLYWVADAQGQRRRRWAEVENRGHEESGRSSSNVLFDSWPDGYGSSSNENITDLLQKNYGVTERVVRLRGYGNAIVPQIASEFISAFMDVIL